MSHLALQIAAVSFRRWLTLFGPGHLAILKDFYRRSYEIQQENYKKIQNPQLWKNFDTVDAWRHRRMYQQLDPFIELFPHSNWMTIGDGRYGNDAHYLEGKGREVTATDLSVNLLEQAQREGYIKRFQQQNAEHLSFADDSFDFVLCKEAYHHFPRPWLAVYEMLRVARVGVILIEPNDTPILKPASFILKQALKCALRKLHLGKRFERQPLTILDSGSDSHEDMGNYVYCMSQREIEKVAGGLGLPVVAFSGVNDHYIEGGESEPLAASGPIQQQISKQIRQQDRQSSRRLSRGRLKNIVAVILKTDIDAAQEEKLVAAGYFVHRLPRNPFVRKDGSTSPHPA